MEPNEKSNKPPKPSFKTTNSISYEEIRLIHLVTMSYPLLEEGINIIHFRIKEYIFYI